MQLWEQYHVAASVEQALGWLADYGGAAQVVAGGTDLLLEIQQGSHPKAAALVDITRVPELTSIHAEADMLTLGAGVTHNAIVAHAVIRAQATCLAESCGVVGGPQVRNVATIGGNVAHALPAADGTLSLVALDAQAELASAEGRTWLPIGDLFLGAGKSRVNPAQELITRFRFKLAAAGEASAFKRIMRPQGVALPILGCAAWVQLDAERERFTAVRLVIAPTAPTPIRAAEVEAFLIGKPANAETLQMAADLARQTLTARTSKYRATAEYRSQMIALLARDALTTALERAVSGEVIPIIGG